MFRSSLLAIALVACRAPHATRAPAEASSVGERHSPPATPVAANDASGGFDHSVRQVLVGNMCPDAAAGAAGVTPMFLRHRAWVDADAELSRPVARGQVRQFSVLAWDGRRAGVFSVAGAADVGRSTPTVVGGYAGAPPCRSGPLVAGAPPTIDAECEAVRGQCGLALAVLEPSGGIGARPYEEAPDPVTFTARGACVTAGMLVVDTDGDGGVEAFSLASFREPGGALAGEIAASPDRPGACEPRFAFTAARGEAHSMYVLGVLDFDGDGRTELVVSFDDGGARTWAIYTAPTTPARLERVSTRSL